MFHYYNYLPDGKANNVCTTQSLNVFTQRNFIADSFSKNVEHNCKTGHFNFCATLGDLKVTAHYGKIGLMSNISKMVRDAMLAVMKVRLKSLMGPFKKYVTLEGGGGQTGCDKV